MCIRDRETIEPSDLGADMVVGSLIKNPGGGLAPIGGYICGTQECVDRCAYRLSAPGLGQEVGANLGLMPALYQGLFLSPTVVSGALKGAVFAANIYAVSYTHLVEPGPQVPQHRLAVFIHSPADAQLLIHGLNFHGYPPLFPKFRPPGR